MKANYAIDILQAEKDSLEEMGNDNLMEEEEAESRKSAIADLELGIKNMKTRQMTSKELLFELIRRQKKNAHLSRNWDKLEVEVAEGVDKDSVNVTLEPAQVGFSFDKNGRFNGIYNYQQ